MEEKEHRQDCKRVRRPGGMLDLERIVSFMFMLVYQYLRVSLSQSRQVFHDQSEKSSRMSSSGICRAYAYGKCRLMECCSSFRRCSIYEDTNL